MCELNEEQYKKLKEEIKTELKNEFQAKRLEYKQKRKNKKAILGVAILLVGFGLGFIFGTFAGHERSFQGEYKMQNCNTFGGVTGHAKGQQRVYNGLVPLTNQNKGKELNQNNQVQVPAQNVQPNSSTQAATPTN